MSSKSESSPGSNLGAAPEAIKKDDLIDEDLSKLPAHIQSVRDGLLDFYNFMGLQAAMLIAEENDEDGIPLSAYKSDSVGKLERAREFDFVESAKLLASYAKIVEREEGSEWNSLFRVVMTGRMDSACSGSNMYKSIAWSATATATSNPRKSPITISSPGMYFGFSVQKSDQRPATGFRNDSSFDNYTRESLARLTTQGLHCVFHVPSSVDEAKAQTTSKEPQPHSVCFPWGIFEAHGVPKSVEENDISFASAVSEVSAAVSSALSMFERLAKFADEKHDGQHIPPMIAITSVGANVTKMINIWEGTITKIWDAIQFCRIMDNLFFWAQHCLKPKVTQYLSQWRLRYCPDVPNIYSLVEKDTRTAEIIHQTQDHLSSLGIPPNEDLPALVRQAVVFQEVMRSSGKEVKSDSTPREENKVHATAISLPSCPSDIDFEADLSRLGVSFSAQDDPKVRPKDTQILRQDSDFLAFSSEKGNAESFKPDNTNKVQLKSPPKYQTSFLVFPETGKESTSEDSTVLKDAKAIATNISTNTQNLKSKFPTISEADGRDNNEIPSNPRQTKTSSAEERKGELPGLSKESDNANLNFVQRSLRSMTLRVENGHVLSLKEQKRRNLDRLLRRENPLNMENPSKSLSRTDSNKEISTDPQSSVPNHFVLANFEFSFDPILWLDLDSDTAGSRLAKVVRYGPYPTLGVGPVEHKEYWRMDLDYSDLNWIDFARQPESYLKRRASRAQTVLENGSSSDLDRINLARQAVIIEPQPAPPASPLMVKIPWKDKHIRVKLPPVSPASVSINRRGDSPER